MELNGKEINPPQFSSGKFMSSSCWLFLGLKKGIAKLEALLIFNGEYFHL